MKTFQMIITPLLVLALSGCTAPEMLRVSNTLAVPPGATAQMPKAEASPALSRAADSARTINQGKFSLVLKNVEIKQALAILSKESPVPIVAEPGVTGRVTINIKDKPLGDLLFILLRPMGYTAMVEDGMIVVGPRRAITRTFVLDYLKDKRSSNSTTKASISSGSDSGSGSSGGGSSSSSSSGNSQGNVSVTTTGGNDFWSETLKGIEAIVYGTGKKDGGTTGSRIVANQLSGVVQVTAPPETLELVDNFVSNVELEVKRQVLIQAHFVEIDLKDDFSLGIDWKAFLDSARKSNIAQTLRVSPLSNVFVIDINTSSGADFTLLLDTFKEQGDINMLSSPKISTLNNQKAVFKRTTNEVTWVQSVLRGNATVGTTDIIINTPQIDEVGLFLDVTPNVAASGNITMQVHPSISEVKEVSFSPSNDKDTPKSSKPVITVREIDTMIDVKSGQTMVIGGLISDKISTVKRGIPLLGDIPVLGWLFSNYSQQKRKTELVIFLTPYVLDSTVIDDIRKRHEDRLWGREGINRCVADACVTFGKKRACAR